jgi:putative ABC transport system substrate-binding protein
VRRRPFIVGAAAIGANAAAPSRAQGAVVKRVGWLNNFAPDNPSTSAFDRFLDEELRRLGWERGRNLHWIARHGIRDAEGWDAAARELVHARVDAIVTFADPLIGAALRATRTIPIVAISGAIVEHGYAQSLARPGGNVTGVVSQSFEFSGRILALLRDIRPGLQRLGVPADRTSDPWLQSIEAVAAPMGIRVVKLPVPRAPVDIAPMLDAAASAKVQALRMWFLSVLTPPVWRQITNWAIEHQVVTSGTLVSRGEAVLCFGPNQEAQGRLLIQQIDRVLHGANPAETPIMQPTKWDIVISQRLARAVGWPAPSTALVQATEVIG